MAEPNHAENPPPDHTPPPEPTPPLPRESDAPVRHPADGIPVLRPADEIPVLPPLETVPRPPSHSRFWAALLVGGLLYVILILVGGEAQRFALGGLESLPFLGLALLAYAGENREEVRLLTLIYWLLLIGLLAFVSLMLSFASVIDPAVLQAQKEGAAQPAPRPSEIFVPGGSVRLGLVALGTLLALGVGVLGFTPPLRRAMARRIPAFDPHSFVHAIALATVLGMTAILLVPLIFLGEPPLLALLRNFKDVAGDKMMSQLGDRSLLRDQIYATAWLVPVGIMAVGYPLHRTLREALTRVGLVVPSGGQVAFGLAAALILAVAMTFFDISVGWLWRQMGWPTTDEKQFEELMKFAINPLGAVVIGVTAGLGEELFARGVLQPRLGILLANLFFTALHAWQYNWDGLLSVFVIGLILGLIRKKTNTTTSAIVHGTYDFTLILMSASAIDPTKWFGQ
jgi:membrane protease YdiL (CAAX protease family)